MQPKKSKIIKFSKKCRDLNREYELNNNADLDNGVYNAFVNEQEQEAENRLKLQQNKSLSEEDADFNDQIDLSSDDDHALASIRKEKQMADIRDSEVSEANELKIHESCSDLNIVLNNQS